MRVVKNNLTHPQIFRQNMVALDSVIHLGLSWNIHQLRKLKLRLLQIEDEALPWF